ncbi:glycosyl transferase [Skermanella stibiiresistens SB22]|uniref:Glycosyl transferase n=1 Tax=Skermanella stibiiresistens SB22 TaxID=1385369 RepID=W9H106_9PROT|nr:glycosyltransferase family 4 protein [Skermanella stibiiresistens]EWY39734.1 glycosyl transferase [Skermanella stibiiresistens SB22]
MRIAQIAPLAESVPPRLYGGTERIVSYLTEELVHMGHQVTLFASGDSLTSATLVPCRRLAMRLDPTCRDPIPSVMLMMDRLRQRADEFDVLHFHLDCLHFPTFRPMADRTLTTLHGRQDLDDLYPFYAEFNDMPLVSISDSQRKPLPDVRWAGTIHHGVPSRLFQLNTRSDGYLAFLGRVSPEKQPDEAIRIAIRSGLPLRMAAKVDKADLEYHEARIRPLLDHPLIDFIGEIGDAEKSAFLGGARALLFPINWPEPFGMVMIEAMATGTPVIAYRHGSVEEVIEHGVTGFVVDTQDEAVEAVGMLDQLDRNEIRAQFERRFSAERMARDYVELYRRAAQSRIKVAAAPRVPPQAVEWPRPDLKVTSP